MEDIKINVEIDKPDLVLELGIDKPHIDITEQTANLFKGEKGEQGQQGEQGQKGDDGKSAYQTAVEGGYQGTEEEFASELNDIQTKTQAQQTFATKTELNGKQDTITDLESIRQGAELGKTALQEVPSEYVTETELLQYHDTSKQDVIEDLEAIRSGAGLGSTAVQPNQLGTLASKNSVDYETEVTNKPTINNSTITIKQGSITKGTFTLNQAEDKEITLDAGGGQSTDVQINGTSIVESGVANILTKTAYNKDTNKIVTESDIAGKENAFNKNTAFNKNFETNVSNIKSNSVNGSVGTLETIARADHSHPFSASEKFAEIERQKSKNLFLVTKNGTAIWNGLYFYSEQETNTLRLNGTPTQYNESYILKCLKPITIKANIPYTISIKNISGSYTGKLDNIALFSSSLGIYGTTFALPINSTTTSNTKTFTTDVTFDSLRLWLSSGNVGTASFDNYTFQLQVEEGSVATDFVDYNGQIVHENGTIVTPNLTDAEAHTQYGVAHIVETFLSSDKNTWYRIWSDGFKECGIKFANNATVRIDYQINLPLTFSNANYLIQKCSASQSSNSTSFRVQGFSGQTASSFKSSFSDMLYSCYFYCCGY